MNLPAQVASHAVAAALTKSSVTELLNQLPNGTAAAFETVAGVNNAVLDAISAGVKAGSSANFSIVYLISIAFGATKLLASFFITNIDKFITNLVNKTVAGEGMRAEHEHQHFEKRVDEFI